MASMSGENSSIDVTALLLNWGNGEKDALDSLLPLIYNELRRVAEAYLRRDRPGHTLQATALVNEAFLRLIDQNQINWQNRAHFFGVAANLMRQILIDVARAALTGKRGGRQPHIGFSAAGDRYLVAAFPTPSRRTPTATVTAERTSGCCSSFASISPNSIR